MPHLTLLDRGTGTSYRIDSAEAVIGRDPSVALVIHGGTVMVVSGRHARVFLAEGHWWIEDLGSRNGTFIGTRRLTPNEANRIQAGDEIGLGGTGPRLLVEQAVGQTYGATLVEPVKAVPKKTISEPQPAVPPRPAAHQVRLVLRSGDGKRLVAQETEVIIGRSRDCGVCVEGDMARAVSRRHARVFYSGWKICIEDLGSRNGTWLNRKAVQAATIINIGDAIEFGAGGPRLVVENVELVSADPARRTETEMPSPVKQDHFVSELPTPPTELPAAKASNDKK